MIAFRREPWLMMSGASMVGGISLVGAGSDEIAAGVCWAAETEICVSESNATIAAASRVVFVMERDFR